MYLYGNKSMLIYPDIWAVKMYFYFNLFPQYFVPRSAVPQIVGSLEKEITTNYNSL